MNPNQIKIDTYKELIEFLEKELNLIRALPDEIRQIDAGKIYAGSVLLLSSIVIPIYYFGTDKAPKTHIELWLKMKEHYNELKNSGKLYETHKWE